MAVRSEVVEDGWGGPMHSHLPLLLVLVAGVAHLLSSPPHVSGETCLVSGRPTCSCRSEKVTYPGEWETVDAAETLSPAYGHVRIWKRETDD